MLDQFVLIVFILMILVSIAGGKPDSVLKPVFEIACNLVIAVIKLVCRLLTCLISAL